MSKVGLMLKGMAMGIAEVIPGVSGGTIAFISGIYEDLLSSIKSFGPIAFSAFRTDGFKGLWSAINGNFLLFLIIGMAFGFLSGVVVISGLIETQPEILWGFFFGLILASCFLIGSEISKWTIGKTLALLIGTAIAWYITVAAPAEGSLNLLYVYLSGVIAISALMLPGVSGSFVLLIMGMYTLIIPTIKRLLTDFSLDDLWIVGVFGLGCLTGLAIFSRILTWLFKSYKEVSFALLTGFMIGSLNKIWPWRNVTQILDKGNGQLKTITDYDSFSTLDKETYKLVGEQNVIPTEYLMGDPKTIATILAFIVGVVVIYLLHRFNKK